MLTNDKSVFYLGIICLVSLSVLLFSNSAQATLNVFACEPEWAALAKELGDEKLEVYAATTVMQDPHHIQARPSLIAKARRADLLICSGAELEIGWLPLLLRKAANKKILPNQLGQFFAADFVDKLDVPKKLDRSHGDLHAEGNPHVHTSPENILNIAQALSQRLAKLDQSNADYYHARYVSFSKRWQQAMLRWQHEAKVLQGHSVIAHHKFWLYLNQWLGIKLASTLEPLPGVSPGSTYLAGLIEMVKKENVRFIMRVGYVNEKPANWLADKTGLTVVELPASVDYHSGETLFNWYDDLITHLVQASHASESNH